MLRLCGGSGLCISLALSWPTATLADISPFKMPSGNIQCTISEDFGIPPRVDCTIFVREGAPAQARSANCVGAWGHHYALLVRGQVQMSCGEPGPVNTAAGVPVAQYGDTGDFGGITCKSMTTGLTCRNADGHGFHLSRAKQSIF